MSPCQTCASNNGSSCLSCVSGYYLFNNSCLANVSCGVPCTCPSGAYLVLSSRTCSACPSTCLTCLSATICSSCFDGYYVSQQTCTACPSNCKTCTTYFNFTSLSQSVLCYVCSDGYVATAAVTTLRGDVGFICTPCSSNCLTCV